MLVFLIISIMHQHDLTTDMDVLVNQHTLCRSGVHEARRNAFLGAYSAMITTRVVCSYLGEAHIGSK